MMLTKIRAMLKNARRKKKLINKLVGKQMNKIRRTKNENDNGVY